MSFERLFQQEGVPFAADPVGDHPCDSHFRMPGGESPDQRRDRVGDAAGVDREYHRNPEQPGDSGASGIGIGIAFSVKEPHHPFDHREGGGGGPAREGAPDPLRAGKENVEVEGGASGRPAVEQGVDVVRSAFEGGDGDAAPGQQPQQAERQRGLAAAGTGSADQKCVKFTLRTHVSPDSRAGSRAGRRGGWSVSFRSAPA